MSPLISVITVTRNAGAKLGDTVRSVLAQDCPDVEYLIKDGDSKDGSITAVLGLCRSRVKILTSPDSGIYDAMNQAARLAKGRYIHFLNAGDEYVSANVLSEFAAFATVCDHADFIYSNYYDSANLVVVPQPPRISRWFIYRTGICHQAQFVSTSAILNRGGFDCTYRVIADRHCATRLLLDKSIRSAHWPCTSISYEGRGFSEQPEQIRARDQEIRRMHAELFSVKEQMLYRVVGYLTLASLRTKLCDARTQGYGGRLYDRIRLGLRRWI